MKTLKFMHDLEINMQLPISLVSNIKIVDFDRASLGTFHRNDQIFEPFCSRKSDIPHLVESDWVYKASNAKLFQNLAHNPCPQNFISG